MSLYREGSYVSEGGNYLKILYKGFRNNREDEKMKTDINMTI